MKIKSTIERKTKARFDTDDPVIYLPATIEKNQAKVKAGFWRKIRRVAGRVPFAEDAIAAYYCAIDAKTPIRIKALLLAALAYFIMPVDMIPDFLAVIGFSDDATVLATVIAAVSRHITKEHRANAKQVLESDRYEDGPPAGAPPS